MKKSRVQKQIWTMAVRNITRRPRRSVLSALAIGVAALTVTLLFSLIDGVKFDMATNLQRYTTAQVLVEDRGLVRAGAQALAYTVPEVSTLIPRLAARPGVVAVSPRITSGGSVFQDGDAVFFGLMGQDFATDPMQLKEFLAPGGRLPVAGEREALISSGLAQKLGIQAGQTLTVVTQTRRGSSNGMTFTLTGVVQPNLGVFQTPWLFTSFETAGRLTKLGDAATGLLITADGDPAAVAADLTPLVTAVSPELTARPWFQTSTTWGLMDLAGIIYGFIALIFCALASTVVINTMLMVVLERSREIGMLAALGMDQRDIRNLFLAESAVLSGLGALTGVVLGCVVAAVLSVTGLDYTEAMKGVNMGVSNIIRPQLLVQTPIITFVLATGVALVFTLVPVGRLRKLAIVDALRGEL